MNVRPQLLIALLSSLVLALLLRGTTSSASLGAPLTPRQHTQQPAPAALSAAADALAQPQAIPTTYPPAQTELRWRVWQALAPDAQAKVDPRILAELRGSVLPAHLGGTAHPSALLPRTPVALERTRFLIYLREETDLTALREQVFASQAAQRNAVFTSLMTTTRAQQAALRTALEGQLQSQQVTGYQPFYIVNAIAVDGNIEAVAELAQRADVARLVANYPLFKADEANPVLPVPAAVTATVQGAASTTLDPQNWNIAQVRADLVWNNLGVRGAGAVVAGFDTGVTYRHPALIRQYRGNLGNNRFDHNYNWFEPNSQLSSDGNLGASVSPEPRDCDVHGTHTMGTAVGSGQGVGNDVGMAPDARWIAVPGICFNTMSGGIRDDIGGLKAFQWLLCPTDLTGDLATADCSKAPDVVNNSWGSANPVNDVLRPAIQALRAANIAPVFAAGNPDAGPGSIGTPANAPEAITVGATDGNDEVAYFSGRGPSFYAGEQKPELSAPGVDVKSTVGGSEYTSASGTSMAAPHVTGLIALMVAADLQDGIRDFSVDELEQFMIYTAVDLGKAGPDDDYGYGRIDAYAAVRWVLDGGDLRGTVRDAATQAPLAGAVVRGLGIYDFDSLTGATGNYSVTVPAGSYNVTLDAWGYNPRTFASQPVLAGALSLADFALTALPKATVQGIVQSGGSAVADATIYVQAQPTQRTTSGSDGTYSLSLPVGQHQLVVEHQGYRVLTQAVTVAAGDLSQDLALAAAPSILLVEADAYRGWFSGWSVRNIFDWALTQQHYRYDLWRIEGTGFNDTTTQNDGSTLHGIPSLATLAQYDVVIWVQVGCDSGFLGCYYSGSPSSIDADDELMAYMDGGGRLIISGQDLGYWEDGGTFFADYLHAEFISQNAASEGDLLAGAGFLENIALTVTNATLYGYRNGSITLSPDAVEARSGDSTAYPLLFYSTSNRPAALAIDSCVSNYRAVYYSVGFENIGPRAANRDPAIAETLGRSIRWVNNQRPALSMELTTGDSVEFNAPGQSINHILQILNTGQQTVTLNLATSGGLWPTQILSGTTVLTHSVQLPPCETLNLTVAVQVPANVATGTRDQVTLRATIVEDPQIYNELTLTSAAFDHWQRAATMPTSRFGLGAVAMPNSIYLYAVGGWYNDLSNLDPFVQQRAAVENERYNACTERWETMAPLPDHRANIGAAVLNGKLYVVGGTSQVVSFGIATVTQHATVFVYDPVTNRWREVAPLPVAYAGMAVVGVGDKLYAFGGVDGNDNVSKLTYIYNPASDQWQTGAPLPGEGRYFAAATFYAGKIYLVGGFPAISSVLTYDPATNQWANGPELQVGRHSFGLTPVPDGYLYAVGGAAGTAELRSTERFSTATGKWEPVPATRDGNRDGVAAVYTAGRIYALGGEGVATVNESLVLAPSFCLSDHTVTETSTGIGNPITYTVELHAPRNDLAAARFSNPLPPKTSFAGFVTNELGAQYNETQRQVEWQGRLAGGSAPQKITYRINTDATTLVGGERLISTVYFDNGSGTTFTRTVATEVVAVNLAASTKSVSREAALSSDVFTYTIHLQGQGFIGSAVALRDPLPLGINYLPDTLTYNVGNGRYDEATRSILWAGTTSASTATYRNLSDDYVWGDSDGGGEIQNIDYVWIDISATGNQVGGGDIVYTCELPVGFAFPFYGELMQEFCVSTNGFVSFDRNGAAEDANVCPLPSNFGTGAIIAALWDDLVVDGQIYYETLGTAPNRYLVVQWHNVQRYGEIFDTYSEFQVVLSENGVIRLTVQKAGTLQGLSSTTGIEAPSEAQGITYACNEVDTMHDEQAIVLVPPNGALGAAMAEIQFQATGATDVAVNAVVTNTAIITTVTSVLTRAAPIMLNPVKLDRSAFAVAQTSIAPGEIAHYQLLLANTGLMTATNATLAVALPSTLRYAADSLRCSSGVCSENGGVLTWNGAIVPGQPYTITFAAALAIGLPDRTPVLVTATLADGHGRTYTFSTTVLARRSDLSSSLLEIRPPYGEPGQSVLLTVLVHNRGSLATTGDATIVLPPALLYQADSLVCGVGTCTYNDGKVQWQGALAARAIIPIRFGVQIPPTASYGERFTFTATVRDVDWAESFTREGAMRVAHLYYIPVVNGPELANQLYLPLVEHE